MRFYGVAGVMACFLLCGCGSVSGRTTLAEGDTWYPGVKTDVRVARGAGEHDYNYLQGTIWTLDMPFSLIGDTLMLPIDYFHGPWVLPVTHQNEVPKPSA